MARSWAQKDKVIHATETGERQGHTRIEPETPPKNFTFAAITAHAKHPSPCREVRSGQVRLRPGQARSGQVRSGLGQACHFEYYYDDDYSYYYYYYYDYHYYYDYRYYDYYYYYDYYDYDYYCYYY